MRDVIMKRKTLSHDVNKPTTHLKITDYNKDHDI